MLGFLIDSSVTVMCACFVYLYGIIVHSTPLKTNLGDVLELVCDENASNLYIQVLSKFNMRVLYVDKS